MSKILVIAEKPSVARDIAKVLKATGKGEGFLFSEKHVISWAIGHLVTLYNPDDYDKDLKKWKTESLPIIPKKIKLKAVKNTNAQLKVLQKLMISDEISEIICATDSGREGELIFRYIYEFVNCKKKFSRLWISSMTDKAIKDGFNNLKDGIEYDNLYYSAKCRSEADWLVGINASRAYTLKYNVLLSIGRVQTPTLAVVANRQVEIDNFKSILYFEIDADFDNKYIGKFFYKDKKTDETKIETKEIAEDIINKIKNKIGIITNIDVEEKRQLPPFLFDLTELQRECNRKFGFSAKKTLTVAQDLYEKRKLITYPRTDSRFLSDDMISKLKNLITNFTLFDEYKEYANYILALKKLPITKRIVDNEKITDHHAIIPTEKTMKLTSLSIDERKVYDLIILKFLSVFYPPYLYNITKIITEVEKENFITKGNTIINLGYMEIYKRDNDKKKANEDILPNVKVGEEYKLIDCKLLEKKSSPPKAYTEAMLLSAMENAGRFVEDDDLKEQLKQSGIGTPATRASIIERLIEVGYMTRKGKTLVSTEKGLKLIEVAPKELVSAETTGKWEKGLNLISQGKMEDNRFMESIKRYVNFLVDDAKNSKTNVIFPEESFKRGGNENKGFGTCPACAKGKIFENKKAYFCNMWKSDCKFNIWKDSLKNYGLKLEAETVKKLLKDKTVNDILFLNNNTKKEYLGDLVFKDEKLGILEIINLREK